MEYLVGDILESGPRQRRGFSPLFWIRNIYGRLRLGRTAPSQLFAEGLCFPLLNVHHQLHFGVDVAADLEGSRLRKGFGNILARGSLIRVEQTGDVNLMDEFVVVGEGQRLPVIDRDLAGAKGPPLLGDGMGVIAESRASRQQRNSHDGQEEPIHRVTA
jgi:hypothetical protein